MLSSVRSRVGREADTVKERDRGRSDLRLRVRKLGPLSVRVRVWEVEILGEGEGERREEERKVGRWSSNAIFLFAKKLQVADVIQSPPPSYLVRLQRSPARR